MMSLGWTAFCDGWKIVLRIAIGSQWHKCISLRARHLQFENCSEKRHFRPFVGALFVWQLNCHWLLPFALGESWVSELKMRKKDEQSECTHRFHLKRYDCTVSRYFNLNCFFHDGPSRFSWSTCSSTHVYDSSVNHASYSFNGVERGLHFEKVQKFFIRFIYYEEQGGTEIAAKRHLQW